MSQVYETRDKEYQADFAGWGNTTIADIIAIDVVTGEEESYNGYPDPDRREEHAKLNDIRRAELLMAVPFLWSNIEAIVVAADTQALWKIEQL